MPRTYVFLIHGIGKQPASSWSEGWQEAILQALRQYPPYDAQSPADLRQNAIRFVPVGYDHVFEGYRKRWVSLAGALNDSEVLQEGPLKDALSWIANDHTPGLQDAFWTYALDAVLWLALPQARAAVIAAVLSQTVEGVKQMLNENGSADHAHWIAHSLGTSVLHDALVSLRFDERVHEGAFDPANFKWQSVSMVANTSRLLCAQKVLTPGMALDQLDPYRSLLKPGSAASIARSYHNFHHRLDPITWPMQFRPLDFVIGYSDDETQHFLDPRHVHDFTHYLANPRVQLRLLRTMMGNHALGGGDVVRRIATDFIKQYPLTGADPFRELRGLFGDSTDNPLSVTDVARYLSHAFKALEGFA